MMRPEITGRRSRAPLGSLVTLPRLSYSIEEAVVASGLSRSYLYEAIRDGRLVASKAGSRTLLMTEDLHAFISSLPKMQSKP